MTPTEIRNFIHEHNVEVKPKSSSRLMRFIAWFLAVTHINKNFMDGYAEYAPDVDNKMTAFKQFFSDCSLPGKYNVSYIYLEGWQIRTKETDCVFSDFDVVYNESDVYVFKVS